MFWHRTLKLTGTFIGYGICSVGAGIGAASLIWLGLETMNIDTNNNPIVPLAGVGTGVVVAVVGLGKMKEYASCSITEETLPIEHSELIWIQESNTYTRGDQQVTEYRDVAYTRMNLKGINGPFDVRGDFRDCRSAKMRLYRNDGKNCIVDWDFMCGYRA
ncbi:hypothetical protein [Nostoc sp. C110]|uniref:hypothetical protein n=1 Tax=Nostoc sp. C110 TaxID=3349876 RepID=UPI00370D165C